MTPEEFRKLGHLLVDWIADYRSDIEKYPVRSQVEPSRGSGHFLGELP